MFKFGVRADRWWQPLVAIVIAYAVAAQTLLIALGALTIAAQANEGLPAFEICHHGQLAPDQPGRNAPFHHGCNHCIFCFAASHHAVIDAPTLVVHRMATAIIDIPWAADKHCRPRICAHSIANPRGPPRRA